MALLGFLTARSLPARDEKNAADNAREEFELMKLFAEAYGQVDLQYVREVDRRKLIDNAIRGMLSGLDPWSSWIPPQDLNRFEQFLEQEFVGIGIQLQQVSSRSEIFTVLPQSPADRAGIRPGDVLLEVDAKSVTGLLSPEVSRLIAGPEGQSVKLLLRRNGTPEPLNLEVTRERIQMPTVIPAARNPDGSPLWIIDQQNRIACIRLTQFSRNTAEDLRKILDDIAPLNPSSLILDLRSNPGGRMDAAVEISDLFLDSGRIVSVQGRSVKERIWDAKQGTAIPNSIPVAILINRQSASASEVCAAALQDNNRALLIGERSFGKGTVQSVVRMEGGKSAIKLTTAGYLRPSGINIHRFPEHKPEDTWGVRPADGHEVSLNSEQFTAWQQAFLASASPVATSTPIPELLARDSQLQHALKWAQNLSPTPAN
ncbi:MAG: Carboxy-terminal processing protease CtpA precursor [Planctomycetota bacterium]|jgi:carboxyl-terminal processing protease